MSAYTPIQVQRQNVNVNQKINLDEYDENDLQHHMYDLITELLLLISNREDDESKPLVHITTNIVVTTTS